MGSPIEAQGGFTPGPWSWFGNAGSNSLYLATEHSGRRYVMGFKRWGMRGAQPQFQPADRGLVDASELVTFAVGNRDVRGVEQAKADSSVYRLDINGIDCADARLIAASPDLLEAAMIALSLIEGGRIYEQQCCDGKECGCRGSTYADESEHFLRKAIAKATGGAA